MGRDVQERSYTVGGSIYWHNYFAKQFDIPMFKWTCGHPSFNPARPLWNIFENVFSFTTPKTKKKKWVEHLRMSLALFLKEGEGNWSRTGAKWQKKEHPKEV